MRKRFVICVIGLCLLALGLAGVASAEPQPGPVLSIVAHLEPCLTIELSDNLVSFHVDKGPGVYDADRVVDVRVATNYGSWTVNCSASALTCAAGSIPASRIFASHTGTLTSPDEGASATYVNMGIERAVATGGPQALAVANTLRFRLKTDWTDRPGQYTGTVSFTYLAAP